MKRHFLFLKLIFLLAITNLNAQNESEFKNKITLGLGTNDSYMKDDNLSPLHIKGPGIFTDLAYERCINSKDILHASLNASISGLKSEASSFFNYNRFLVSFEVNYLKKVNLKSQLFTLHTGLGAFSTIDAIFYKGTNAVSFFSLHGMQSASKINYQFHKKQNVNVSLFIPLIGVLNRPPYTGWNKEIIEVEENGNNILNIFYQGDVKTIGAFLNFDLNLGYAYSISKLIDVGINHKIKYWYTKEIEKVIINTNFTSAQLTFKF